MDVDDDHSKRRITKFPDRQAASLDQTEIEGWADQLKAAAIGTPSGLNTSYKSTNDQGTGDTGRRSRNFVRRGSSASDLSVVEETVQYAGSSSNTNSAATPPKKMLKIRSDGRLGSPRVKGPALDEKPKRGRKSTKAQGIPEKMVARIEYGTDPQSRSSTGSKIAAILSGATSNPTPTHSKPNRSPEPPKQTHPFFLGGSKHDQRHQELPQHYDERKVSTGDRSATSTQEKVNPIKARVTSKPPEIFESPTGIFQFGDSTFRTDCARTSRFPGAIEPLWPSKGMVHVRQDHKSMKPFIPTSQASFASNDRRKMKEVEVRIPTEEQILTQYVDVVKAYRRNNEVSRKLHCREWRELRRPLRRVLTRCELQQIIRQEIASELPTPCHDATWRQDEDKLDTLQTTQNSLHPAVRHMYKEIQTSLSAFDKFECETQDWVHKFAPACADQVLQTGREVYVLRDWLRSLTTNSVGFKMNDSSRARESSVSSRRATTRRKRRRAEELDDFVLSSDEEANEMCHLTDSEDRYPTISTSKRSMIRSRDAGDSSNSERVPNAVVISGPQGCGKTAAVYAVARELGFEVFEINAGSRRSGRDLLDKVGDMSRNHLVKRAHPYQGADSYEGENMKLLNERLKQDLDSGRQGTMNSFFKSTRAPKKSPSKNKPKIQTSSPKQGLQRKHQSQKQSFILLEEVDVLFDEDKTFWTTTLELLVQSKRPIIMTCTDESLLPLEDMSLHAILRFTHAPEQLATDYMLLVACNEGHILPRTAVTSLYKSKGFDLRASMTELNFFCQMAVGDTKGGLEWMLIPTASTILEKNREPLRVVSEGTYQPGMGWPSDQRQASPVEWSLNEETEMLSEVWYRWGLDLGAGEKYISPSITQENTSRTLALQHLQDLELVTEAFSAADTFPGRLPLTHDTVSHSESCLATSTNRLRLRLTPLSLNSRRKRAATMSKVLVFFKQILSLTRPV